MNGKYIEEFMKSFYSAISCEKGQQPEYVKLQNHFVENAILAEYIRGREIPRIKSIETHINEIKKAFETYKFLSENGFFEEELNKEIVTSGQITMIKSSYEKRYFDGEKNIVQIGVNHLQIIKINNEYKILSVAWYED